MRDFRRGWAPLRHSQVSVSCWSKLMAGLYSGVQRRIAFQSQNNRLYATNMYQVNCYCRDCPGQKPLLPMRNRPRAVAQPERGIIQKGRDQ